MAQSQSEVWVDDDYDSGTSGWGVTHFDTIPDGLDAVEAGGTVHVAAGGYTEALLIDKAVSLLGPQADVVPVAGGRPGGEAVLTLNGVDHPLQIVADDVTVNGFEITDFFYGPEIKLEAVADAQRSNVTLNYNSIHSNRCWTGMLVGESTGSGGKNASGACVVSDITVAHNIIDINVNDHPGYSYNRAMSFTSGFPRDYGTNSVVFRNIDIADNEVNFSGADGPETSGATMMFAGGGTTSTEAEFRFEDFRFTGNLVTNFNVVMNSMNFHGAVFEGNTFRDIWYGLYVNFVGTATEPVQFTNNTFENVTTGRAIKLAGNAYAPVPDAHVEITGNTFNYNQVVSGDLYSAVSLAANVDASTIELSQNRFLDGGVNAAPGPAIGNDSGAGAVSATENYWGSATPDFGTLLSGPVDYLPYYLDYGLTTLFYPVRNTTQGTGYLSIQPAIDAADPADVIEVSTGSYPEALSIGKALSLLGPNVGIDAVTGVRSAEAEVTGQVTVTADDVTIDGFALTNPTGTVGIYAKRCSGLTVANNVIHDINSSGAGSASGVYVLGDEPSTGSIPISDIVITGNFIHDVGSASSTVSTKGIYFGDSNGVSTVSNVLVQGNKVETVLTTRGAYGIILNYGFNSTGSVSDVAILDNIVTDLEGLWVHGIGLETDTASTVVQGNEISDLRDNKSPSDAVGIFFEGNPSGAGVVVSENILRSSMGWGVAIHPNDLATYGYTVDASSNYWDSTDGPSGEGAGSGAATGPNVGYASFYADEALTELLFVEVWVDDDYDGSTPGWGSTHFATVQDGIDHAAPSGTVHVAEGAYPENPVIGKALSLLGANDGVAPGTARGAESLVEGSISIASSDVTVSGFELTGSDAQIEVTTGPTSNVEIQHNYIHATTAQQPIRYWLGVSAFGSTNWNVSDNTIEDIQRADATGIVIFNVDGLTVEGNVINHTDVAFDGRRGMNIDGCLNANILGNTVDMGATDFSDPNTTVFPAARYSLQIAMSDRATENVLIDGNSFSGCYDGFVTLSGAVDSLVASNNEVSNVYIGFRARAGSDGNMTDGGQSLALDGNTLDPVSGGYVVYFGSDGPQSSLDSAVVEDNKLLAGTLRNTNGDLTVDASPNWWGIDDASVITSRLSGSVLYSPWWADAAMTELAYDNGAFSEDYTVGRGETLVIPLTLSITGGTFTVDGGTLIAGNVDLQPGAALNVVDGQLTIGDSTLTGSFTFFNSMGSVDFNGDVSIAGSAEGLILVCDVHVAAGAAITVDGTLVIDGCTIDSPGSYSLVVNAGADFTMARTAMSDGAVTLSSGDSKLCDNRFTDCTIEVTAGTTGAEVYHNLTDDLGWLTDNGTDTVTTVDGWGNLDDPDATVNNLWLGLDLGGLPADRTQDAEGNVYVQPDDSLYATVEVSDLTDKIAGVEVLLGYSTDYFSASSIGLMPDWNVLIDSHEDDTTAIGKLDAAIGLSFTASPPEGTDADQIIGDVQLTGQGIEGETMFFHRVKLSTDPFGGETILATGGSSPETRTPFTINSAAIITDGSAPAIDTGSATATQEQASEPAPVDVFDPANYVFRNGQPVVMTFTATDAGPAGLDPDDASMDLVLTASNGTTLLDSADYTVTATAAGEVVTYTVTMDIPADATNGTYAVTATVQDRSGNPSDPATLGQFQIANELLATVELQAFTGGLREVTFVATASSGAVLETWTATVSLTGTGTVPASTGSVSLEDVPAGTVALSAKTAWNLRSKVAVSFTPEGVGTADLTGTKLLPGGDLTGDNVVNILDYSALRYHYLTTDPEADINGDGEVKIDDYALLQANFYTGGDAL